MTNEEMESNDSTDDVETSENNEGQNPENEDNSVQTLTAKMKHWREKAQKLEEQLKGAEDESNKTKGKSNGTGSALETAQKALLNSLGYKETEEHEFILGEAERLGKDLSEIVNDSYFKSKLKDMSDERKVQSGMPKGKGGARGAEKDVDYWIRKGETPKDLAMAEKVIQAKEAGDKSQSPFSDDPF